jgi:hypothetical protein
MCCSTVSLNLDLEGGGWLTRHSGWFTPWKKTGNRCVGGWLDPRASPVGCGKSRPHWFSIPDLPGRSNMLYQLHYPGTLWGWLNSGKKKRPPSFGNYILLFWENVLSITRNKRDIVYFQNICKCKVLSILVIGRFTVKHFIEI